MFGRPESASGSSSAIAGEADATKPIVMIPVSFLGGGVFCVLCDLLARTIFAPVELSISSVTAVFLAPVVIYMMVKERGRRHGYAQ